MEPQQALRSAIISYGATTAFLVSQPSRMEPQQALPSAVIRYGPTTGSTMRGHPVWTHNRLYDARSSGMEPQQALPSAIGMEPQQPSRCCNRLTRSHSRLYEARLPHTDPQQALGSAIISCGATTGSRKRLPVGWRHDRLLQVLHSGME